jgi:hypothetical protein
MTGLMAAVHAGATVFMAGVIWFVQVVHYPLLDGVGPENSSAYQKRHTRSTTWVVAPAMLVELAAALWLAWRLPAGASLTAARAGLVLLAVIWVSTWGLQVPQHRVLEHGFDARAHRRLVLTNWVRTAAWTARAVLALFILIQSGT